MELITWWAEYAVSSCLEMTAADDLQSLADVNDQCSGLVRHVVPLLVLSPNLQTADRNRREQCRETNVGVTVHAQAFGRL